MSNDAQDCIEQVRWTHSLLSPGTGLHVGPVLGNGHSGCGEAVCHPAALKEALAEVARMDRVLKLASKFECVLCPRLLDNLPSEARSRGAIFDTISNTSHISYLLLTGHPEQVLANLPANWSPSGPANVCIAVILDGGEEENRQRLEALRKIPAKYRGIWVPAASTPVLPEGWEQGIHWVVAYSNHQTEESVRMIRSACQKFGIPCFLPPGGDAEPCAANPDGAEMPHHPFKAKLNLHKSSPYGRLMRPKPSPVSVRSPATEVDIEHASVAAPATPLPDPDPCPGTVSPTARDEAASPCDPPATAVMAPCVDVVENVVPLPINAVIIEPRNETTKERFIRLDKDVRDGLRASVAAGFALREIRDDELWREGGYKSWNEYCESFLETSRSYINRRIDHAIISRELLVHKPPIGLDGLAILPAGESQSRPLKKLPDRKQRSKAWRLAVKRADGLPTAQIVTDVVAEILGNASVKAGPSRGEQRLELIKSLREAALSRDSWDHVANLINLLEKLESPNTHTK